MKTEEILKHIKNWDREDINVLFGAIQHFKMREKDDPEWVFLNESIDWTDLPSEPVPSDLAGYPIWAMDKNNVCLVGEAMDSIETLEEIQK